jgi:D-3-phosphoglycerate dehydrogenase
MILILYFELTAVLPFRPVPAFLPKLCPMNSAAEKNVVRFDLWLDKAFDARLAGESAVHLQICAADGADDKAWAALAKAHVYQISAAKDELPKRWVAGAELLERCPSLLCVSSSGAGYDTVDVPACTRAGVAVVNQAGGNAASVAEHALGLLLAVSRRIVESDRRLRSEQGFPREDVMGHEIGGKVIGLVGLGHTGKRVAALAHAFGMKVLATDPYLERKEIIRLGAKPVSLDELLAESDVVSLHCPRNPETMRMIDANAFARMKRGSIFITTARGGIHDESALLQALQSGQIAGAGLDVWDTEPPPLDHPLLKLRQVVATFHTAGVTHEARRNVAAMAAEQIVGLLNGEKPPRLVNPEVWPAYVERFQKVMGKAVLPTTAMAPPQS